MQTGQKETKTAGNQNIYGIVNMSVLAIGKFDGVHIGHAKLLKQASIFAEQNNLPFYVLIISPSPSYFFSKNPDLKPITSLSQRAKLINSICKTDKILIQKFTQKFANTTGKDFVLKLKNYGITHVFAGNDFHFGKNREYSLHNLSDFNIKPHGINLINLANPNGQISTYLIRNLIKTGQIKQANNLLGYNYYIKGEVIHGAKMAGKILGFKTANIKLNQRLLSPLFGVYLCKVQIKNEEQLYGICNIGIKPTIESSQNKNQTLCEVHIFNFNKEIYSQEIEIKLTDFLRSEKKFDTIKDLKDNISNLVLIYNK